MEYGEHDVEYNPFNPITVGALILINLIWLAFNWDVLLAALVVNVLFTGCAGLLIMWSWKANKWVAKRLTLWTLDHTEYHVVEVAVIVGGQVTTTYQIEHRVRFPAGWSVWVNEGVRDVSARPEDATQRMNRYAQEIVDRQKDLRSKVARKVRRTITQWPR